MKVMSAQKMAHISNGLIYAVPLFHSRFASHGVRAFVQMPELC